MQRCPWCGAEMKRGADECTACDKSKGGNQDEREPLISRDVYENTRVPVWLFVVIVGIFLVGLVLIFFQ